MIRSKIYDMKQYIVMCDYYWVIV